MFANNCKNTVQDDSDSPTGDLQIKVIQINSGSSQPLGNSWLI